MTEDRVTVRHVVWKDVFPWLILLRTFRVALRMPILAVAALALLIVPVGWRFAEFLFVSEELNNTFGRADFRSNLGQWRAWIGKPLEPAIGSTGETEIAFSRFLGVFFELASPFVQVFRSDLTVGKTAYFIFGGLWSLGVWAFVAAIITRLAGIEFARDRRTSVASAARHTVGNFGAYFGAPLYPLAGILVVTLPLMLMGLMMRSDFGVFLGGLLFPLCMVGGLIMAVLLVGLLLGWPLMWPVISLEEQGDAFEALSRSYSFALQKPLHYLWYVIVASVVCGLAILFVNTFAEGLLSLTHWGFSWGAGASRMDLVASSTGGDSSMFRAGQWLFAFWSGCVRTVAMAYPYAFFWCAMTAVYLLLRRDVDQTEFDDVYFSEETSRPPDQLLGPLTAGRSESEEAAGLPPEPPSPVPENVRSDNS